MRTSGSVLAWLIGSLFAHGVGAASLVRDGEYVSFGDNWYVIRAKVKGNFANFSVRGGQCTGSVRVKFSKIDGVTVGRADGGCALYVAQDVGSATRMIVVENAASHPKQKASVNPAHAKARTLTFPCTTSL